ncbi:hypothetical protein JW926_17705 [Candidatus Sumerlaeota bacterium]|nr:hypothetical protein [Candidatus Sumerlaeota bacterium]
MKKWTYHVISNTHWDREWRYPFQAYRSDLVSMMDNLLSLLENTPEYRAFFLDSQTVILEDYLEIRPENKKRIGRLVESGRLQIGPWYTLPDEWGCPGEALVRNLLMGHKVAKNFGLVTKVGYTPFSNGQISQLPQIYNGFGIDSCFFYRGVGKHVAKPEFIWESPDGSRVFGFRFGAYARYNYYYLAYRPGLLGRFTTDRDYLWNPDEIPSRVAVETANERPYAWMNQKLFVHEQNLDRALSDVKQFTKPDVSTHHLLFMMGHDHSFAAKEEVDLIRALEKRLDPEQEEIFHSSLTDYLDAFRKAAPELEILKGEMRHTLKDGLWTHLFAQILSCRAYVKQENARICAKVLYGSEPLCALSWITGGEYPRPFLEVAWKKILINQAHDAIGGCSVDPVHREMFARWSEVETLSDELSRKALMNLASHINASNLPPKDLQLTIVNPTPFRRSLIAAFIIDIPSQDSQTTFSLETPEGIPVPLQILSYIEHLATIEGGYELSMPFPVQRFKTCLELTDLPAMGYETLVIKPGKAPEITGRDIALSHIAMENEFLNITVNPNGALKMTDKKTGLIMDSLAYLEDEAEFGDPWSRNVPPGEPTFYSLNGKAASRIVSNGPLQGTLEIKFDFPIPLQKDNDQARSRELATIPVSLLATLQKGSPLLELAVHIENRARDHRLRILFPSGINNAEYSFADGQFDVLKRPIKLPDSAGFKEPPYPTHPLWNFVDVSDGKRGFAVINNGLIEYEVKDDAQRTVAITLLRGFGKFTYGRPVPDAQCLGKHVYRFFLFSHKGTWEDAGIFDKVSNLVAPLQALQSAPTKGDLPMKTEFLRISPDSLVFSGIKQSEDGKGVILRLWNPMEKNLKMTLETALPVKKARLVTLEEKKIRWLPIKESRKISLIAPKKKIITLNLLF